jgi:hypothetical protein
VVLCACSEQNISVELTESDKVINAEGFITDNFETQYFEFHFSSDLGDETPPVFLEDVNLVVHTEDGDIVYDHDYQGRYRSRTPFQGNPGESYIFEFSQDGKSYYAETAMPYPCTVDSVYHISEFLDPVDLDGVRITVSSLSDQYIGYNFYYFNHFDSSWQRISTPVYWVNPVVATAGQTINLNPPSVPFFYNYGDSARLDLISYSNDVGDYLLDLRTYMTTGQVNNQFFNPPSFYTGNAFGMAYGRIVDTHYFSF